MTYSCPMTSVPPGRTPFDLLVDVLVPASGGMPQITWHFSHLYLSYHIAYVCTFFVEGHYGKAKSLIYIRLATIFNYF